MLHVISAQKLAMQKRYRQVDLSIASTTTLVKFTKVISPIEIMCQASLQSAVKQPALAALLSVWPGVWGEVLLGSIKTLSEIKLSCNLVIKTICMEHVNSKLGS